METKFEFAGDHCDDWFVLLPPAAVPHISQICALGANLTASPRGEKPLFGVEVVSFYRTVKKFPAEASPLREKLSKIGSSEPIFD